MNTQQTLPAQPFTPAQPPTTVETDPPKREAGSRALALFSILPACLGVVYFALHLGLWIDELYSLHAVSLPWCEMAMERLQRGHPLLYFALLKASMVLWSGGSHAAELALRLPSMLFWAAALLCFSRLARPLLERRLLALAISLLALNQLGITQAANARMYSLLLLESTWATFAYLALAQRRGSSRKWTAAYLATCAAGISTSPSFLFVFSGFLFDAWRSRRQNPALLVRCAAALCLGAAALAPGVFLYLTTPHQMGPAQKEASRVPTLLVTLLSGVSRGARFEKAPLLLQIARVWGTLLSAAVLWQLFSGRSREQFSAWQSSCCRIVLFPVGLIALTAVASAAGARVSLVGSDRYLISCLPASVLLVTVLLGQLADRVRLGVGAMHLQVVVGLSVGLLGLARVSTEPFRAVMQELGRRYRPGEPVIVIPQEIEEGVKYYVPGATIEARLPIFMSDEAAIEKSLAPLARQAVQAHRAVGAASRAEGGEEGGTASGTTSGAAGGAASEATSGTASVWMVWYRANAPKVLQVADRCLGPGAPLSRKSAKDIAGPVLEVFRYTPGR